MREGDDRFEIELVALGDLWIQDAVFEGAAGWCLHRHRDGCHASTVATVDIDERDERGIVLDNGESTTDLGDVDQDTATPCPDVGWTTGDGRRGVVVAQGAAREDPRARLRRCVYLRRRWPSGWAPDADLAGGGACPDGSRGSRIHDPA